MSKNTWRAERFRSADVRRSAHQRAAKSVRKIYQENKPVDETTNKTNEDLVTIMLILMLIVTAFCFIH